MIMNEKNVFSKFKKKLRLEFTQINIEKTESLILNDIRYDSSEK